MFGKLGVWDTERNNGVLIYLLLAEHAIEIVADRGLNRHVAPPSMGGDRRRRCRRAFRARRLRGRPRAARSTPSMRCSCATSAAPPGDVDVNELPDAPLFR